MIILQQKLKEYVDAKSLELLAAIFHEKTVPLIENKPMGEPVGYMKHKDIMDLGEILGPVDIATETLDKRIAKKTRKYKDENVGYDEIGFLEIYKLVNNILKENSVAAIISEYFLVNNIFEWLVKTYRKEIENIKLSDFIITECIASVDEFKIYIPILHLESDKEFTIGNVHFLYLSEEYIRHLSLKVDEEKRISYVDSMLRYKGQLMGACIVKAEKEKAIELAIRCITFSVDVLRIASPTIDVPEMQIFFDVDFRNIHQVKSDIIMQPIKEEHNFTNQFRRKARPFEIVQRAWDYMDSRHLGLLSQFAFETTYSQSELEGLIRNGIQNFSKAIANHDYHERITKLFTVLESLLLPNDSSPIIDSVCKYLPKLITKDSTEREKITATVKEMYTVRSAMIHHAKKKSFDMNNLAVIQTCTKALIIRLIQLAKNKQTKAEILKEIDDIINRA